MGAPAGIPLSPVSVICRAAIVLVILLTAPTAADACCVGLHLYPPGAQARDIAPEPPLAIGDSVMLGAARNLARAGFEVDAREGRFMRHALRILRKRRRDGLRPPVVVIAIGTNFPATSDEIRRALGLLGPGQRLVFVTPKRSWSGLGAGPLWAARRHHPRRVGVLDWVSYSAAHAEWFYGDGTHLRPSGARAYTQLLRRALPRDRGNTCHCVGVLSGQGRIRNQGVHGSRS
jgi:hypothetical protein